VPFTKERAFTVYPKRITDTHKKNEKEFSKFKGSHPLFMLSNSAAICLHLLFKRS